MRSIRRNSDQTLRSDIAHAAARLVAEGEAPDFVGAKRKAAATLGVANFRNLPENIEVHDALMHYLQLFEGEQWVQRIATMRQQARAAMVVLATFRPRLVGPVLYGSACEYSPVTLHLYTDEIEQVTRFLHDARINYRLTHTNLKISRGRREDFPTYLVVNDELDFNLVVFADVYFAHPPLSSLNGRPFKRADIDAVDKLISDIAVGGSGSSDLRFDTGGP